jgi:hypothetical protein
MDKGPAIWSGISFLIALGFQISGFQNIYLAGLLWAVAVVLSVYAFRGLLGLSSLINWLPFGMIPLADAAHIAYRELGDTLWREAVLKFENTAEGRLNYLGTGIAAEVPIFGRKHPFKDLHQVPKEELGGGSIGDGATSLKRHGEQTPQYVGLTLKRRDLRKAIKRMRG